MMDNIPETVNDKLRPYWHFWNLGHYAYFKKPREVGKARLEPFVVDEDRAFQEFIKGQMNGGRWTPAGSYARLMKFQSDAYDQEDEPIWQTVMSDTPDEMNDHLHPILSAHGRVLIHGLGMGCVLNCIRNRPDVTHIDVVEIDMNVIQLIGPFFQRDPKITIHHGSCVEMKWPKGTRWNYVWHDIWTTISAGNLLDDEQAEHGISYRRLHQMFGGRCDAQSSWALKQARQMREVEKFQARIIAAWTRTWNLRTPEQRLEMLFEAIKSPLAPGGSWKRILSDPEIREHMPEMAKMYERYVERSKSKMTTREALHLIHDKAFYESQRKVGMI